MMLDWIRKSYIGPCFQANIYALICLYCAIKMSLVWSSDPSYNNWKWSFSL